jgi:hypothetical protein
MLDAAKSLSRLAVRLGELVQRLNGGDKK